MLCDYTCNYVNSYGHNYNGTNSIIIMDHITLQTRQLRLGITTIITLYYVKLFCTLQCTKEKDMGKAVTATLSYLRNALSSLNNLSYCIVSERVGWVLKYGKQS